MSPRCLRPHSCARCVARALSAFGAGGLALRGSAACASTGARITFDGQVAAAEIALIAQRICSDVSDRGEPHAQQQGRAASLDPKVADLLAAQNRSRGSDRYGAFAEVRPTHAQDIDFARGYFDPARTLARAYAMPASRYYRTSEVAQAIHAAFAYTRKHVYHGCRKAGNWWVWAKQMPDCLTDILALVGGELEPRDRAYLICVLNYLVGKGPIPGAGYHHGKAGKDALNAFKLAVLTQDRTRIAHAWECMENEVSPYLLEPDGTPLMTVLKDEFLGVSLPYIYEGYSTVVEWARLTRGTSLDLRPETKGRIARYLLDFGRWNTFQGTEVGWVSFTAYRVFWRPAETLQYASRLAGTDVQHADQLKAMASGEDEPPDGCRFWPAAETLIFRAPGYYCALVMASKPKHRISWDYKNHFLHNGNRWYYGRDGHLVLVRGPHDSDPNITYTLDWRRLGGVTRDSGSLLESDQIKREGTDYWQPGYALCENPMAGAVTLAGRDGVAGIEVRSGETRARKSYFFLRDPNMIVTLGSHIGGLGQTDTIVHTVPISANVSSLVVNGKALTLTDGAATRVTAPCWIHGPGGGYYFPEEGAVTLLAETRSPDFSDAGYAPHEQHPQVPDQRFISIYFNHGEDPVGAAYACAYFPSATADQMPELAQEFAAQATYGRTDTGHFFRWGAFTGAAFFRPGQFAGCEADRPCFLAIRKTGTESRLALYEPSWENRTLTVRLPFTGAARAAPQNVHLSGDLLGVDAQAGRPIEFDLILQ